VNDTVKKPQPITAADLATVVGGGRLSLPHTPRGHKRAAGTT
jgi:hypothetical protein